MSLEVSFEIRSCLPHPVCSLCLELAVKDVSSQLPACAAMSAYCNASPPGWTHAPLDPQSSLPSIGCLGDGILS